MRLTLSEPLGLSLADVPAPYARVTSYDPLLSLTMIDYLPHRQRAPLGT